MRANKKAILFFLLSSMLPGLLFLLSGCTISRDRAEVVLPTKASQASLGDSPEKRFQEPAAQGPTVAESAMELSKKYAQLSEEATLLRQENENFTAENSRLKNQVAALEAQLRQAQKELTEANDLLVEMHVELNNWKADVLGFRGEMREAEKAQLQALLKILKVLGGEVRTESTQSKNVGPTTISQTESAQPVLAKNPVSGETDE